MLDSISPTVSISGTYTLYALWELNNQPVSVKSNAGLSLRRSRDEKSLGLFELYKTRSTTRLKLHSYIFIICSDAGTQLLICTRTKSSTAGRTRHVINYYDSRYYSKVEH
jgi:hypothetical protein